jgi:hypothetical protein
VSNKEIRELYRLLFILFAWQNKKSIGAGVEKGDIEFEKASW